MDAKIDYLSWTVLQDVREAGQGKPLERAAALAIWNHHPIFAEFFGEMLAWETGGARGHYSQSLFQPKTYAAIRFGGSANHILVELPGTACQWLRDKGMLNDVIREAAQRLTRIDVAVDFPSGCSPAEFVGAGYNQRFKAHATIVSPEGTTEYVGSMKSERYARIYQYNPPHPRAGTTRIEHVLRSDYARAAAASLVSTSLVLLVSECGNSFAWKHALWTPDAATDGKLRAQRSDRHEPGRVRWLDGVVFPAMVKAHREGLIDLREWFQRALEMI